MARETSSIADVIGRGYDVGRAIGDDFASWKFRRAEAKLQQQLDEEAAAAKKPIEQFLAENPERLRQYNDAARALYTTSGARKRGVTAPDGSPLFSGATDELQERVAAGTNRAASQEVLSGNFEGAQRTLARGNALYGNVANTQANVLLADQIKNSTAAINPDGTVDTVKATAGLPQISARRGDTAGAVSQTEAARQMRFKVLQQHTGDLQMMMNQPQVYGMDNIVGKLNALIGLDGRFGSGVLAQADASGGITLMRGEQPLMTLMQNGKPTKDVTDFLANASTDYEGAVQQYVSELRGQAEAEAAETKEHRKTILASVLKVAEGLAGREGVQALSALTDATEKAKAAGWEFTDMGDGAKIAAHPQTGQQFVFVRNEPGATDAQGQPLPAVSVQTIDGQAVSASDLQGLPQIQNVYTAQARMAELAATLDVEQAREFTNMALDIIGAAGAGVGVDVNFRLPGSSRIGGALGGKGGSRAERNNNPGNIKDVGQFDGMPGYKGKDNAGFAVFETPEQGTAAMHMQLQRYMDGQTTGKPLRSVAEIVGTWSPQSDPKNPAGSTDNYTAYVAQKLGVDPNQPLPPSAIPQLAQAMAEFESGNTGGRAVGGVDSRAAATSSPVTTMPSSAAVPAPARRPPPADAFADAKALRARRAQLEQALADFDAQEKPGASRAQFSRPTDDFPTFTPALNRTQQGARERLVRELARTTAAEKAALKAARRRSATESDRRETTRLQEKYGLPPADPQTAEAFKRWGY